MFFNLFWSMVLTKYSPHTTSWNKYSLDDYAKEWSWDVSFYNYSTFRIIWVYSIWWARNMVIFQDKNIPIEVVMSMINSQVNVHKEIKKNTRTRSMPPLKEDMAYNYFDGVR